MPFKNPEDRKKYRLQYNKRPYVIEAKRRRGREDYSRKHPNSNHPKNMYKDKETTQLLKKTYENNRKYTPRRKFGVYKRMAKIRGLSFELIPEAFMAFWQEPCHYCGGEIKTIGLDRVDNTQGYTIDNIVPCCLTCNIIKSKYTLHIFEEIILNIIKQHGVY